MGNRARLLAFGLIVVLLAGTAACGQTGRIKNPSPTVPPQSAWSKLMTMVGPHGEVGPDMALKAVALLYGPVPGVSPPDGPAEPPRSGTPVLKWARYHWDRFTAEQRAAIETYAGPQIRQFRGRPITAPALAPSPAPTPTVVSVGDGCDRFADPRPEAPPAVYDQANRLLRQIETKLVPLNPRLVICFARNNAQSVKSADTMPWLLTDNRVNCLITVYPVARSGQTVADALLIHELMHCMYHRMLGPTANAWGDTIPPWVEEGLGDWAASEISGAGLAFRWDTYLSYPSYSLLNRTYDAIGFFGHVANAGQDVWRLIAPIVTAGVSDGGFNSVAAFNVAIGGSPEAILDSWPASMLREAGRGARLAGGVGVWDLFGRELTPAPGKSTSAPPVTNNGAPVIIPAPALGSTLADTDLQADVIMINPIGEDAVIYGRFGPGGDDYLLTDAMTRMFCTKGECKCKDGSEPAATLTKVNPGRAYVAVTGGVPGSGVSLRGMDLERFCREKPKPCRAGTTHRGGCQPGSTGPTGAGGGGGAGGARPATGCAAPAAGPRSVIRDVPANLVLPAARGVPAGAVRADATSCAASNGDPHLTTFDGLHYDLMSVGEFLLVDASAGDLRVQARATPVPGTRTATVNSAVAVDVAGDQVGVYQTRSGPVVRVNGTVKPMTDKLTLPRGGTVSFVGEQIRTTYMISWPDGTTIWLSPIGLWGLKLEMYAAPGRRGTLRGPLGNFDGDATNDLSTRDGKRLPERFGFADLYPGYADSWRISQAESLFFYEAGETTRTFTDRAFPDAPPTAGTDQARAVQICRDAGITDAQLLADCVLDVQLTGDAAFAAATAGVQTFLTYRPGGAVAPTGTIGDGQAGAGNAATKAQKDRFHLNLAGADRFYIADWSGTTTGCDQSFSVNLVGVSNGNFPCAGGKVYFVVPDPARSYDIEVDSVKGPGPYRFRLVTVKPKSFSIQIGASIGPDGPTGAGSLDVRGRVDAFTFAAAGNRSVRLTGTPVDCTTSGLMYDITDAAGSSIQSGRQLCGDNQLVTLPDPAARYTITVRSETLATPQYTFQLTAA